LEVGVSQGRVIDFAGIEAAAERTPRPARPRRRRRGLRLFGGFVAWTLLVPSAVSVGLELERAEHVETWQAITTLGWWQQLAPTSFESATAFVRDGLHPAAWSAVQSVLELPPAPLGLSVAFLLFLLLALLRTERAVRRWVGLARGLGIGLAGLGFAASGADLYQSGASHSLAEFVALLHAATAQSLLGVEQPILATAVRWPAWLALLLPGSLLLYGARIGRRVRA
jgi:hypothetical protein